MSINIDAWINEYQKAVENKFGNRIWFIGLQGSYGRGEATEQSDIDMVLILDNISIEDLKAYSDILDTLPERSKACGFISGKEELFSWEPSDLFQFYYDTVPIKGSLDILLNYIQRDDIRRAIHIGACNVYHICVHNLVHEKSLDILKAIYKSAVFILQAIAFYETGKYERQKSTLQSLLKPKDQNILQSGIELKEKDQISKEEFDKLSELMLKWASKWIQRCKKAEYC